MKWPWPHERAYTVYCLDEDFGEPIWKRTTPPGMAMLGNTGSGPHGVATQSQINALDCDDERIVIGLERVSPADIDQTTFGGGVRSFVGRLVDVRQCFTVQCLNAEG